MGSMGDDLRRVIDRTGTALELPCNFTTRGVRVIQVGAVLKVLVKNWCQWENILKKNCHISLSQ